MSGDANCDFETKSGADIKLGLARYFADPEADVLCLGYELPDGTKGLWVAGEDPNPFELLAHVRAGGRIRGWNVGFEWHAWNLICVPKYGWPPLPIEQCVDTMAEAQAMNLPAALEKCGVALGLPADRQKGHEGKLLIRKLCVPQKPTKNQPLRWLTPVTHPELHEKLRAYCTQDVVAEKAIERKLRRLSVFEQLIWVLTAKINQRGIPVAIDEVANIHDVLTEEKDQLNKELRRITSRQVSAATNRGAMLTWINARPEMQAYDPVFFEDEEDSGDESPEYLLNLKKDTVVKVLQRQLPADVRRVLEIRQQVCQTSTAKFPKLLKIAADDDTLKNMFVYHGAGPGRWASRGGWNAQNLTRPTLSKAGIAVALESLGYDSWDTCSFLWDDQLMEAGVNCLRGVIKAPEGYEFIDADYSSVENRVASWIAGQTDKLEMFEAGLDEYKTFASKTFYQIPYDEVTSFQRQDMKPVILGGIFGLGGPGLVDYAEKMGVTMTLETATAAIKALRSDYHRVRSCWYACQDAAISAIETPGQWFPAGDKLRFVVHNNFLWMKLPSGRPICWARPIVKMMECPWFDDVSVGYDEEGDEIFEKRQAWRKGVSVESVDTFTRQWCRHQLIGSSMFQSGVQATARDILAQGLVNVEDAGYSVVFMAHDELMAVELKGTRDPEEFGRLMCRPAPWFADLPLAFEAWAGARFRK